LLRLGLGLGPSQLAALPSNESALKRLAIIGSYDLKELIESSWPVRSIRRLPELPSDWVVADRRRIAPGMPASDEGDAYIRCWWQIRALPCDPHSGEMLIDRCACGEPLLWTRTEHLWHCKCGHDVRSIEPQYADKSLARNASEVGQYLITGNRPALPAPFDHVSDVTLLSAMEWFGRSTNRHKNFRAGPVNAIAGYQALKRWPISFDQVVKEDTYNVAREMARFHQPELQDILQMRAEEVLDEPNHFADLSQRGRLLPATGSHTRPPPGQGKPYGLSEIRSTQLRKRPNP
jgi:hypothetical protein